MDTSERIARKPPQRGENAGLCLCFQQRRLGRLVTLYGPKQGRRLKEHSGCRTLARTAGDVYHSASFCHTDSPCEMISRRTFIKQSTALLGTAAATGPWIQTKAIAPSDTIRIGAIGINGMGWTNVRSHLKLPEVNVVALCDVDNTVLQRRAGELEEMTGAKAVLHRDYRALLDDQEIDAVIVATPDHWHPLITMHACEAGKDVYVEKPLANSIAECNAMVAAASHYQRVVQVGQWQRSGPHWDEAMAFVQSGQLGKVRTAKAWAYQGWMRNIPIRPDSDTPDGVDYDLWLGPAPQRPFNPNRFHFTFRWFWDYAGGLMTDWGVHLIDMALYGMQAISPKSVLSTGGAFAYPDGGMETPDTQQAVFEYDGFSMIWEHAAGIDNGPYGRSHGVSFIGNNGTLVVDRGGWEVIPEGEKMAAITRDKPAGADLDRHTQDFVHCMQTRSVPKCPPEVAWLAAVNAHLGNVAFKTGRKVYWDHETHTFGDDEEANALIKAHYRAPWVLPSF